MRPGDLWFFAKLAADARYRRYAMRWLRTVRHDYLLREGMPWITFAAIDALGAVELRGRRVFEYGSGGSTLYWMRRGAACVSIESDEGWYERIRPIAREIDYRLVAPQCEGTAADPADPDAYGTASPELRHCTFRDYCTQIDEFADGFFDVVLVDGRARPSCIRHAAPKVRRGGLLIVDNSDRGYYFERTAESLRDYDARELRGPGPVSPAIWSTTIFTRR